MKNKKILQILNDAVSRAEQDVNDGIENEIYALGGFRKLHALLAKFEREIDNEQGKEIRKLGNEN